MYKLIFISLITILAFACATGSEENLFSKEKIKDEVKSMLQQYHEAVNENGLLAEFDFLDQSEYFFWIPPGYKDPLNYEAVESILRRTDSTLQSVQFQWESLSIIPLSSEICNYSGKVKGHMILSDSTIHNIHLIESGTIIKRNDGWKLLSGQSANL